MAGEKERGGGNQGLSHMLRVSDTQEDGEKQRGTEERTVRGRQTETCWPGSRVITVFASWRRQRVAGRILPCTARLLVCPICAWVKESVCSIEFSRVLRAPLMCESTRQGPYA